MGVSTLMIMALGALALAGAAQAQTSPQTQSQTQAPSRQGPNPGEQAAMHQGDPATNGSSTIVHDENGAHLDGYPHMAVGTDASGRVGPVRRRHHHHHHAAQGDASRS